MESIDVKVLRELRDWRAEGWPAVLATVVHTWGSSPRPVGAMMALRQDGRTVGSVSGGCVEDDLVSKYGHKNASLSLAPSAPLLVRYGVSADEAHRFGLPCGGTIELLLEFNPSFERLIDLLHLLDQGKLVRRTVSCGDGEVTLAPAAEVERLHYDGERLVHTLGPGYRMLLIGAGALTEYLATMAVFNGFVVTVCDPRAEYAKTWTVPGVIMVSDMPDDAVVAFRPDRRSCIVALTHDPKLDDLALLEALYSNAFYVGAIGSRRNSAQRRERLAEHFGATAEALGRLRGPVGIHIGSKTPAEIAVSVMAEILAVKNGVRIPEEMSVLEGKHRAEADNIEAFASNP